MRGPEALRRDFTERCTACGLCAVMCPAFSHRSVPDSFQDVQKRVRSCLEGDPPANAVLERAQLCNECYLCVTDTCPQGLDPMRTNQLVRGILHQQGVDPRPFVPPSHPQSFERIAAALLTTEDEYRKITTPAVKGDGRILFFPGCNIYYQPDLLLTALDILDVAAWDWTFLPGLEHCCGNNYDSAGRLKEGMRSFLDLISAMGQDHFEALVVWCPTCAARLHHGGFERPVISFARLAADSLSIPPGEKRLEGGVTLHEPCKGAYLDLDTQASRILLKKVTGEPVREMARHGRDTVCCSWALHQHRPEAGKEHLESRLKEAAAAGARTLVTVCHGCQWIMDRPGTGTGVRVVNYVRLVGDALGIYHRERFRELHKKGSPEAAMEYLDKEMGGRLDQLPFDHARIRKTVGILLGRFYGT
jgi:heterodisulfide reductase subunit D